MSLVTKTIDSRILGKKMNLAVYRPAVNNKGSFYGVTDVDPKKTISYIEIFVV